MGVWGCDRVPPGGRALHCNAPTGYIVAIGNVYVAIRAIAFGCGLWANIERGWCDRVPPGALHCNAPTIWMGDWGGVGQFAIGVDYSQCSVGYRPKRGDRE
jgi:hypothetical protein